MVHSISNPYQLRVAIVGIIDFHRGIDAGHEDGTAGNWRCQKLNLGTGSLGPPQTPAEPTDVGHERDRDAAKQHIRDHDWHGRLRKQTSELYRPCPADLEREPTVGRPAAPMRL